MLHYLATGCAKEIEILAENLIKSADMDNFGSV
jgi:hypothetical protein